MKSVMTWFNRCISIALATLLVLTLGVHRAEAKSASLEDLLTSAGKNYLSSVLEGYTKSSQETYGGALKQAQKLINSLADDLEKAADPDIKVSERTKILKDVNASKTTLADLAASIKGLATDTDNFDQALQKSVEDLLSLVKGDVRTQFKQNKTALEQISSAIAALSDNAAKISESNLTAGLEGFGDKITALNQALELGGQALKTTASFLK
ncbi:MAG TPA: hypothetical protein IGR64_08000 [Leptolyngbyaceae cyanobacterium M65_K2018_010]|nr:hypothetical protein [Leptolyngbyaceae cyanobacterium M65_K2018_010]